MSTGLPGPVCARYAHRGHQKILEGRVYRRHCCLNATHWCTAAASLYVYSLWREPRRTFLHMHKYSTRTWLQLWVCAYGRRQTTIYTRAYVVAHVYLAEGYGTSVPFMAFFSCMGWHAYVYIEYTATGKLHTFLKYIYQRTTDVDNGHLANA